MAKQTYRTTNPPLPLARSSDGSLFVDPVCLCRMIDLDLGRLGLQLLIWRSLAELYDLNLDDDPRAKYLPLPMVPDFLETLKPEASRLGNLDKLRFYQQMFEYIIELSGEQHESLKILWSAEKMMHMHRFLLNHLAGERESVMAGIA